MLATPPGGGAGGGDPASVLSNLPDGSGPITAIVVAVCTVLAVAIPVLGRLIPDRATKTDTATGATSGTPTRADLDALSSALERIGKLETELRETKADVKNIQSRYEAEVEHSHDLEMQLAAAHQRLERAGQDLAELRAQLAIVLPRLHAEPWRQPQPPPAARRPARGPAVMPEPDEAPTDPISRTRGARP